MRSVWIALGLFFTLWWTWVGFAVLYNRHGADDARAAAAVPGRQRPGRRRGGRDRAGLDGRQHGLRAEPRRHAAGARRSRPRSPTAAPDLLRRRITRACLASAALFAVSIWRAGAVPLRCCGRSASASSRARCWPRTARRRAGRGATTTSRRSRPPTRRRRSTPHHFAERFGLFLIILLGEVVVEAGQASVDGRRRHRGAAGRRWSRR